MGRRRLAPWAALIAGGLARRRASATGQQTSPFRPGRRDLSERRAAALVGRDGRGHAPQRRAGAQPITRGHGSAGRTHERYEQYVNGIRVVGGEVTRQIANGVTTSIFGELRAVSGVPDRPELSEEAARDMFTAWRCAACRKPGRSSW